MVPVHKFLAPRVVGGGAEPCVSCGQYGSSPIHRVPKANEAAIKIIEAHIPSLTDAAEAEIERRFLDADEEGLDYADAAYRVCACGKPIDGFYEYADHLKEVLS